MKPIRINQCEQPLPLWVKPILLLFAALACLAIVFIGCSPVDVPADTATVETVEMDVEPPQSVNAVMAAMDDPLTEISQQLQALAHQQATLQTHQAEQNTVVEQQQLQISALQDSVTQLTVQRQDQHLQLQQRLQPKKLTVVQRTGPRKKTPTLSLVSIDHWGESQTAVIQDGQQLIFLREGERYRGWKLVDIHSNQQQVELINAHQQPLQLSLH